MWSQHIPTGTGRSTSNKIYHLQSTHRFRLPLPWKSSWLHHDPNKQMPPATKILWDSQGLLGLPMGHLAPPPRPNRIRASPTIATAKARSWDHRGKGIHVQPQRCPKSRQVEQPIMFFLMEEMFDVFVVVNGNELEVLKCVFSFFVVDDTWRCCMFFLLPGHPFVI